MRQSKPATWRRSILGSALAATCAVPLHHASAATFKTLVTFPYNVGCITALPLGLPDCSTTIPSGPYNHFTITNDTLYGTSVFGGVNYHGTIYSVALTSGVVTDLYDFNYDSDGPEGTLLRNGDIFTPTASGYDEVEAYSLKTGIAETYASFPASYYNATFNNLTSIGDVLYGTSFNDGAYGHGVVYSIAPNAAPVILYSFTGGADGSDAYTGLTYANGLLYGTTWEGGSNNTGVIYSIDPKSGVEKALYSFTDGSDGGYPLGITYSSAQGLLYGVTFRGGTTGYGTVYSFNPATNTFHNIYEFQNKDDSGNPVFAPLVIGDDLFVAPQQGTSSPGRFGAVVDINLKTGVETTVYDFTNGKDGSSPSSPLVLYNGKLYGTTNGFTNDTGGSVYEISR